MDCCKRKKEKEASVIEIKAKLAEVDEDLQKKMIIYKSLFESGLVGLPIPGKNYLEEHPAFWVQATKDHFAKYSNRPIVNTNVRKLVDEIMSDNNP